MRDDSSNSFLLKRSWNPCYLCVISLFIFASLTGLLFCSIPIRNAKKIKSDPALAYINPNYRNLKPENILRKQEKNLSQELRHDKAIALTRFLALTRAEKIWHDLIREDSRFLPAYLSLGRLYLLLEERKRLKTLYQDLTQKAKSRYQLYRIAKRLYQEGRIDEALLLMETLEQKLYKHCLKTKQCFLGPALWLAKHYRHEGMSTKERYYYSKILKVKPHGGAFWGMGRLAYLDSNWSKAIHYFRLAQKHTHKSPTQWHYYLANTYYKDEKIEEAYREIQKIPRQKHFYHSIQLYGDILLKRNFQAVLHPLVLQFDPKSRHGLLRYWYGVENINGLENIQSSFTHFD